MDQLEQDREIVEFCKKSLSYRKQLSGEEHEVRWKMIQTYKIMLELLVKTDLLLKHFIPVSKVRTTFITNHIVNINPFTVKRS